MSRPLQDGDVVGWTIGGQHYETRARGGLCPICFKIGTIVALPAPLLKQQTDGTTHVCMQALGGCNHGFAVDCACEYEGSDPVFICREHKARAT